MIKDVAIIGAGPVGIFSIFANGMQTLSCVIIDALDRLGGQCACLYPEKYIYDIPAFPKITGKELIDSLVKQAMPFHPQIELNSFVRDIKKEKDVFLLELQQGDSTKIIQARSIIIALGSGVFKPVKPELKNIEKYENTNVLYYLNDLKLFENKVVAIAGGGDSAIDWALMLQDIAKKVYLIHRREYVRAHPASWQAVQSSSKIQLKIPYQITEIAEQDFNGEKVFAGLKINNGINEENLDCDYFLPCFGLRSDLNFLDQWGLELKNHRIMVNPLNMRTNHVGVYAIGDCIWYEHKRKLIVSGFSEAMQAAPDIFTHLYPEKAPIIGHSTTLGVPNE